MFPQKVHQQIYFWSAIVMVFGMPLGKFFMSVGTIAFVANWLLEGELKTKLKQALKNKIVVGVLVIFALHLLGLFWTNDFAGGIHDLKIKLPFFVLPFCFASKSIFSENQIKRILLTFVGATFISAAVSTYTYVDLSNKQDLFDVREISIFISHIRQSMMVVFSMAIVIYFSVKSDRNWLISVIVFTLFFIYLIILQSLTGLFLVIIFLISLPIFIKGLSFKTAVFSFGLLLVASFVFVSISTDSYHYYFTPKKVEYKSVTSNGSKYAHFTTKNQLENGYYVWHNLAEQELKDTWEERSSKPYLEVNGTLKRFITSLGKPKDGESVKGLSKSDVNLIEKGVTSQRTLTGIIKRIDNVFFELAAYTDGQNPSHNSVSQRFFAWGLGGNILIENKWTGVGTRGTKIAYEEQYDQSKFIFTKRIRAHNQFLTLFLSFGFIGGLICLIALLIPVLTARKNKLFLVFYAIILLSFLMEDTLETQPGVLFTAFFLGLFLQYQSNSVKKT